MAADLTERVQEIAEARGVPESEVFEQALERGVEDMWLDLTISRYLNRELSRSKAVESVGRIDSDAPSERPKPSRRTFAGDRPRDRGRRRRRATHPSGRFSLCQSRAGESFRRSRDTHEREVRRPQRYDIVVIDPRALKLVSHSFSQKLQVVGI